MAVSKRLRHEVMKRDNFTCRYCRSTEGVLTIDHVVPVTLGGTDEPDNLVACCTDCNAGKSSTSPSEGTVEDVKAADTKWADAIKRAAEVKAEQNKPFREYMSAFADVWPQYRDKNLPRNFETSIRSLFDAGLPVAQVQYAVEVALSTPGVMDRFRYFCGVSWRQLRELQEIAKALLEAESEAPSGS